MPVNIHSHETRFAALLTAIPFYLALSALPLAAFVLGRGGHWSSMVLLFGVMLIGMVGYIKYTTYIVAQGIPKKALPLYVLRGILVSYNTLVVLAIAGLHFSEARFPEFFGEIPRMVLVFIYGLTYASFYLALNFHMYLFLVVIGYVNPFKKTIIEKEMELFEHKVEHEERKEVTTAVAEDASDISMLDCLKPKEVVQEDGKPEEPKDSNDGYKAKGFFGKKK